MQILQLQATVTESMMTPVPALVLTLAFLCQGWGKHFLLDTKDSNLTDLQYNEDYLSTCRSGCTQNYHCPRQCPYCRRGDEEYRRLKVTDWEGKKRKKRAVNGLKVEKRCYATKQQRRATTKKSGGSCFGPTNTVETKEGMKTLCELRIGDLIRTSSGDHHTDFTEVSETWLKNLDFTDILVSWLVGSAKVISCRNAPNLHLWQLPSCNIVRESLGVHH